MFSINDKRIITNRIKKIGLTEDDYSINEGLKPDAYIIEENNGIWNLFYYDEKGEASDLRTFIDEKDAYESLLNQLNEDLKLLGKNKFR